MSLFRFELLKIFTKKSIWITLFAIIGLFLLSYSGEYKYGWDQYNNVEFQKIGREVAKGHEGVILEADIVKAEKLLNEYEQQAFTVVYESDKLAEAKERWEIAIADTKVLTGSRDDIFAKVETLERQNETLEGAGLEKNNLHIEMLKNREEPFFAYSNGWRGMIDYFNTYGLIALAVLIILGLSSIFSQEDETGVNQFILSSKHGRKKLVTAKIAAGFVYVLVIASTFYLIAFIHHAYLYTLEGGEGSLQLMMKYMASPYSFTLMEYHFVQIAIYLGAALAFSLLVLLVSALVRNSLISFFISGVVFGVPLFMTKILDIKQEWIINLFSFSYTNIMGVEELFMKFKAFTLFGNVVTYSTLAVAYLIAAATICFLLLFVVNKRKQYV
jgi:ABC-type transport system involved in multi-copper enzyme maturation permease subunit